METSGLMEVLLVPLLLLVLFLPPAPSIPPREPYGLMTMMMMVKVMEMTTTSMTMTMTISTATTATAITTMTTQTKNIYILQF